MKTARPGVFSPGIFSYLPLEGGFTTFCRDGRSRSKKKRLCLQIQPKARSSGFSPLAVYTALQKNEPFAPVIRFTYGTKERGGKK